MSELETTEEQGGSTVLPVSGMYKNWFLDYASYVILERAVPLLDDGLKPVQRRILHAMMEMEDGRYNKVANVIGSTMQYHPHGDASIGDAIVNIGQKGYLIDTQGNWGDEVTGDEAGAPRYIEARLSKLALDTVFNPDITDWQLSYDGRKREPVALPVKIPLLLLQGVEGIAVGLSTKIMPHNFKEVIQAAISYLKNEDFVLYPDFPAGGMVDISNYNDGARGGKIRVRATIEEKDSKLLIIRDVPYGVTSKTLCDSIEAANEKGKIKIKKITDLTSQNIEIHVELAPGQSADLAISALYAFTDCEISISPNACIILDEKPLFTNVREILRMSAIRTVELLKAELMIKEGRLKESILFGSLEKIFIENRIYRQIEECETWESVIETIDKGLDPYKPSFYREITRDDILKLTEIKIKRISKFDSFKADEIMRKQEEELKQVQYDIAHIIDYTIAFYLRILEKHGKGRDRKTQIRSFENITASQVAATNQKLYVNFKDGFVGYGLKKDEFVCDCSDLDLVVVFCKDGMCKVVQVSEKAYVGKDIIHLEIFRKNDERKVYNMVYTDGEDGVTRVKRFQVLAITRDKEYRLAGENKNSKVLYFTANPNGEAEVITAFLTPACKAKKKVFDFDFASIEIKGRNAAGNILTKYPVKKIQFKLKGKSTLDSFPLWYHQETGTLNRDERGILVGRFLAEDHILVMYNDGNYEITNSELTNRYPGDKVVHIAKFDKEQVVSLVYFDGQGKTYNVKRFQVETTTLDKKFNCISEHPESKVLIATTAKDAQFSVQRNGIMEPSIYDFDLLTEVKGWKAVGTKLPFSTFESISLL